MIYVCFVLLCLSIKIHNIEGSCLNCASIPKSKETFDCSGCNLYEIPAFPNFSSVIILSNNIIHAITNHSFNGMSSLHTLFFDYNELSEIAIGSFLPLKSLHNLTLRGNKLSSYALESLKTLTYLESLDIRNNAYEKFPDSITKLQHLKELKIDVFKNFYFDERFETLSKLSNITFNPKSRFQIQNDSFEGLINSPITNLSLDFFDHVYGPIGIDFLRPFRYLTRLTLNFGGTFDTKNVITFLYGLRHRSLDYIDLSGNIWNIIRHYKLSIKDVDNLLTICVKELSLFRNRISGFPFFESLNSTFANCLEKIDLSSNKIIWTTMDVLAFSYFPVLRHLDLSIPFHRSNLPDKLFNRFPYKSSHKFKIVLKGFASLEYLDISGIFFSDGMFKPKYVDFYTLNISIPRLKTLKATNTKTSFCDAEVTLRTNLSYLDMSGWQCQQFDASFLQSSKGLSYLNAGYCSIGWYINTQNKESFLRGLSKLESLDLSGNNISHMNEDFFLDQISSLRNLVLRKNKLDRIPSSIRGLHKLRFIDLSFNRITSFDERDRNIIDALSNASFDFYGNWFLCECRYLESLIWIKNKRNIRNAFCTDRQRVSTFLLDIRSLQIKCVSVIALVISVTMLLTMIFIIIIVTLFYKNKSFITYLYIKARRIFWQKSIDAVNGQICFDVFVSFSDFDVDWVTGPLLQYLERDLSLKVCTHERDFIPGRAIIEEVIRCVESSRVCVFVISRKFLASKWCLFEIDIARRHILQSEADKLLIILKDDFPVHEMPSLLRKIWWRIVCLKYPHSSEAAEFAIFWKKMKNAFQKD